MRSFSQPFARLKALGYKVNWGVDIAKLAGKSSDTVLIYPADADTKGGLVGFANAVPSVIERVGAGAVIVAGRLDGGSAFVRELGWQLEASATELVLAPGLTNVAGPRISMMSMPAPISGVWAYSVAKRLSKDSPSARFSILPSACRR